MATKYEAMREALRAYDQVGRNGGSMGLSINRVDLIIQARAALAMPEDEPVAEVANSDRGLELAPYVNLMQVWHVGMKLYAVPQSEPTPEESSLVDEGQE